MFLQIYSKFFFYKKAIIESVNDELKNICQVQHARYRSFYSFIINLLPALAAYCNHASSKIAMSRSLVIGRTSR